MADRLENYLSFTRQAMGLRAYRQELLASNIANADTPYFKAKDIDFKAALNAAMGKQQPQALPLTLTDPRHIANNAQPTLESLVQFRSEYMSAVDGNTVNMDIERNAFAENSLQYDAQVTFGTDKIRTMNTAITSQ